MEPKDYYNNAEIMNNILNSMRFRTNAFLNVTDKDFNYNVQNIVVLSVSNIIKNMQRFFFFARDYNMYSSVARYNFAQLNQKFEFPPFSFNLSKRKAQSDIFNKIYTDYVIAYDFVMDFDVSESFDRTYIEVELIKNQLDIFNVKYILRFSGRGFHIIIPDKFLPDWFDVSDINNYKSVANSIKQLYDLSSLDLAIYDGRRVIKTAYSIDQRSGYVCLPLTNLEFERFNKKYCLPENVIKMPDLYSRNAVLRSGDDDGFERFLKERCGIDGQ